MAVYKANFVQGKSAANSLHKSMNSLSSQRAIRHTSNDWSLDL